MEERNLILTMPLLPLRGLTAFPGTILNFDVERPMSVAALNAALRSVTGASGSNRASVTAYYTKQTDRTYRVTVEHALAEL